jgi:hypothetical protein
MDPLEKALNDARAELQFFRVALQVFYLNVAGRAQEPLAMLHHMKAEVLEVLEKLPIEPQMAQGDQRMKQMTLGHAENFFQHLEDHMSRAIQEYAKGKAN